MIGIKILEERKSRFNGDIKVVRSLGLGTYVQANGLTQSGGLIYDIWCPVLKKVHSSGFIVHSSLILGLGGGTVAKLIRKYYPNAKITGVDIDPVMVELGKKYLGLKDVDIKIQDAYDFDSTGYNLVIVDIYNGDRFPKKFENEKFLKQFTKNKLVIFNRLYYGEKRLEAMEFGQKLQKIFKKVDYIYPEANVMFVCYN